MVEVIWHKVASPPRTDRSVIFAGWRQRDPIHGFFGPHESAFQTKRRRDRSFSFCTAYRYVLDTRAHRHTDHATPSAAIGRIYAMLCMRFRAYRELEMAGRWRRRWQCWWWRQSLIKLCTGCLLCAECRRFRAGNVCITCGRDLFRFRCSIVPGLCACWQLHTA